MPSMNRVNLIGNLTRDPESRKLPSGVTVCSCRLAINESYTDRDGKKVETPCYVDLDLWEKQADAAVRFLHKGSLVLVEGRLQYDEWKTDDGQTRSRLKVRGDRVQFLDRAPDGAGGAPREGDEHQDAGPAPARNGSSSRSGGYRERAPAGRR